MKTIIPRKELHIGCITMVVCGLIAAVIMSGCSSDSTHKDNKPTDDPQDTYHYSAPSYSNGQGYSNNTPIIGAESQPGNTTEEPYQRPPSKVADPYPAFLEKQSREERREARENEEYISDEYEEGYEEGYATGEEDAIGKLGYHCQYDDECEYKGKKRREYEDGYADGYEEGYHDNAKNK